MARICLWGLHKQYPSDAVGNVVGFPSSNGGVTATYAVSASSPIPPGQQTFAVPVEMTFAKNSAPATATAVTVLVAYAPSAAALTGPATGIPTFAVSTATPIPASVINPCQTTLLFPYVTNYQGTYETGLAIANTTTDNLGVGNASTATPTNGSCMINFYGNSGPACCLADAYGRCLVNSSRIRAVSCIRKHSHCHDRPD